MAESSDSKGSVSFDAEYDVIVVGYGYSGGIAAIEAFEHMVYMVDELGHTTHLGPETMLVLVKEVNQSGDVVPPV